MKFDISIVIVNYNTGKYLFNCICSIFESNPSLKLEIIIIDNDSSDNSIEFLSSYKQNFTLIKNDGTVTYSITKDGEVSLPKTVKIENAQRIKLVAMIKETGFLALPFESFSIKEGTETYQKYGLKITLNDDTNQLYWPEADATEKMIPPIITMVQEELESIMEIIRE